MNECPSRCKGRGEKFGHCFKAAIWGLVTATTLYNSSIFTTSKNIFLEADSAPGKGKVVVLTYMIPAVELTSINHRVWFPSTIVMRTGIKLTSAFAMKGWLSR